MLLQLLLNNVDTWLMNTVEMSTRRNAKAKVPYSPGQAAKTAMAKTASRRVINRGSVAQTPVKSATPGSTTVVDKPSSVIAVADKADTLSTALRAELLELLRSTQSQVVARSSTTTSAHEGFPSLRTPEEPNGGRFRGKSHASNGQPALRGRFE